MPDFSSLQEQLRQLQEKLNQRHEAKESHSREEKTALSQLQETMQEKTNTLIAKMQQMKRKETILLTLKRIELQIPEQFPKNYYMQVVYEDAVLAGNPKFTDFDQNIIDQKFVLPLLLATTAKVEVWTAEEQPALYGRGQIDLEQNIESAILSDKCEAEVIVGQVRVAYSLTIQGLGFASWLKNLAQMRELQQQRLSSREIVRARREETRRKLQAKKIHFQSKFTTLEQTTRQYSCGGVDQIFDWLKE